MIMFAMVTIAVFFSAAHRLKLAASIVHAGGVTVPPRGGDNGERAGDGDR